MKIHELMPGYCNIVYDGCKPKLNFKDKFHIVKQLTNTVLLDKHEAPIHVHTSLTAQIVKYDTSYTLD